MQEIEYRAYSQVKKSWIYGLPRYHKDEIYAIQTKYGTEIQVDPETVSQYIGIKDIHQKKVFRGDIVKVKQIIYEDCGREEIEEIREYIGEIVWHQFGYSIAEKIEDGMRYHFLWTWNIEGEEDDTMEVLGNRWDNQEMAVIK